MKKLFKNKIKTEIKIEWMEISDAILLFLSLPPGTNSRLMPVRFGRMTRLILSFEARNYLSKVGSYLRMITYQCGIEAISTHEYFDLWFVLPRTNADSHNYEKILFDALEEGGIVSDDRYIMPRTQGVTFDSKNPMVIVRVPRIKK